MMVKSPSGEDLRLLGEPGGFLGQDDPSDKQVVTYVAANKRAEFKPITAIVPQVTTPELEAGAVTDPRLWSPADVKAAVEEHETAEAATATALEAREGTVTSLRNWTPALVRTAAEACVWNANHYGASPAAADNQAAIQAAVNAAIAAGGGVVTLAPGSYITLSPIVINSPNVWIEGGKVVTIRSTADTQGAKVQISASDCGVRGLKFDGAYTAGAGGFTYGLVDIEGQGSTVARVAVLDCEFVNARYVGVRMLGNLVDTRVEFCHTRNFFVGLFSDSTAHGRPRRTIVHRCRFFDAYTAAAFSGAIKFKISSGTASDGHQFTSIRCSNTGEMGIELWGGMADCLVASCQVDTCTFGISLNSTVRSTVTGCKAWNCSYCGFELAESCQFNLIEACQALGYTTLSGTTRGGTYGIVLSGGGTRHHNRVKGCQVAGWTQDGIFVGSTSHYTSLEGNDVLDCARCVTTRTCNYVKLTGGTLENPAGAQHVVIDITDGNTTDVEITGVTFRGNASSDNVFLWDGNNSRTLTNLIIKGNNVAGATTSSLSVNLSGTITYVNRQIVDNPRKTGGSTFGPSFSNDAPAPDYMLAANQLAGVSSVKKFTIAVPASGSARWFKVFSATYGLALNVMLHLKESAVVDGVHSAQTYQVAAAPYGQDAVILRLPGGAYGAGHIERVIYDNPSAGAVHEIWIKTTSSSAYNLEVTVSDFASSWITSPSFVTVEPTWNANSFQSYPRRWRSALCARFIEATGGGFIGGLPVYANNAAAAGAGLPVGSLYRTGGDPDPVCVVH
jgi:hypothetical protein